MSVQVIIYIINKICTFDAIFSFTVISILNYIYTMAPILTVLIVIKSPTCVLYITNKILLFVLIIMILKLIISYGIGLINVELSVFGAVVVMSQDSSNIFNDKWIVIEYIIVDKKNSVNFLYDKARKILFFCDNNDVNIFLFPNYQYSISFRNFNNSKHCLVLFFKSEEKQENILNEFGANEMCNVCDISIYSNNKNISEKYSSNKNKNKNSNDRKQIECELLFENAFIEVNNLRREYLDSVSENVNCNCIE